MLDSYWCLAFAIFPTPRTTPQAWTGRIVGSIQTPAYDVLIDNPKPALEDRRRVEIPGFCVCAKGSPALNLVWPAGLLRLSTVTRHHSSTLHPPATLLPFSLQFVYILRIHERYTATTMVIVTLKNLLFPPSARRRGDCEASSLLPTTYQATAQSKPPWQSCVHPECPQKRRCSISSQSSSTVTSATAPSSNNHKPWLDARAISDAIIGLSDGLTVPFALTAGLSAFNDTRVVIFGGCAELIAGSISMGLGGWLAGRGEAFVLLTPSVFVRTHG
jgi:hypothetical protein